jgi:hypothetical protein
MGWMLVVVVVAMAGDPEGKHSPALSLLRYHPHLIFL